MLAEGYLTQFFIVDAKATTGNSFCTDCITGNITPQQDHVNTDQTRRFPSTSTPHPTNFPKRQLEKPDLQVPKPFHLHLSSASVPHKSDLHDCVISITSLFLTFSKEFSPLTCLPIDLNNPAMFIVQVLHSSSCMPGRFQL
jgi:hypothetical protein